VYGYQLEKIGLRNVRQHVPHTARQRWRLQQQTELDKSSGLRTMTHWKQMAATN